MRNHSALRKQEGSIPWKWIVLVVIIFLALFFLRGFGGAGSENTGKGVPLSGSGAFVITTKEGEKKDARSGDTFYENDSLFTVISGTAEIIDSNAKFWLDKNSEMSHSDTNTGGYLLSQGKMWIEATNDIVISLKHLDVTLTSGDIALLEQQRIYSIVYIIKGDASINGNGREGNLKAGKRIMVSQSNLINPGTTLESLMGDIDESIQQNAFFLARNGKGLLDEIRGSSSNVSLSGTINSLTGSGASETVGNGSKYIMITSPGDGTVLTGSLVTVEGKSLSPLVKKIIVDNQSLSLSSTSQAFRSAPIALNSATIDIVYKAYDASNNLLERGVITLYSNQKETGTEKLVPKTFPTSDKDFRILSPLENPYKTTLSAVTVSGTVPKGMVEYITVNNFRLKKFVPNSTSWFYYANTSYQTMKEGFNLYEIRFYGQNDTLLSTQLFTIIKEGERTVSGE